MSANAGYSFLGLVISSGILGFAIDRVFGIAPWGLMGFLIIGFVYATYKAQKAMQEPVDDEDDKKGDKKV